MPLGQTTVYYFFLTIPSSSSFEVTYEQDGEQRKENDDGCGELRYSHHDEKLFYM